MRSSPTVLGVTQHGTTPTGDISHPNRHHRFGVPSGGRRGAERAEDRVQHSRAAAVVCDHAVFASERSDGDRTGPADPVQDRAEGLRSAAAECGVGRAPVRLGTAISLGRRTRLRHPRGYRFTGKDRDAGSSRAARRTPAPRRRRPGRHAETATPNPVEGEQIVVTGTRLQTGSFATPTPVTAINAGQIAQRSAGSAFEVLKDIPSFRATSGPSANSTGAQNASKANLDLRGLGASRTLVLINVHRHVPDGSGSPFELPAGPVSLAIGGEWRRDTLSSVNCPDCQRGALANQNYSHFSGAINGKEAYAETSVPLLADIPLVHSLVVNVAVRRTDYSTSGAVTTWKLGAGWDDFEVDYAVPIGRLKLPGQLNVRALGTYNRSSRTITATTDIDVAGTVAAPKWSWNFLTNYSVGDFTASLLTRYTSPIKYSVTLIGPDDPNYNMALSKSSSQMRASRPIRCCRMRSSPRSCHARTVSAAMS